jgi:hypothetical protein
MSALGTLLLDTFQPINHKKHTLYLPEHETTPHCSVCLKPFHWRIAIYDLLPPI